MSATLPSRSYAAGQNDHAQYVNGGFWSERAMSEGRKYMGRVTEPACCGSDALTGQLRYPKVSEWYVVSCTWRFMFICALSVASCLDTAV